MQILADALASSSTSSALSIFSLVSPAIALILSEFDMPALQSQAREAIKTYLNDPQNIIISATPATSTPIMAFIALASNPPALLELLNISVLANQ